MPESRDPMKKLTIIVPVTRETTEADAESAMYAAINSLGGKADDDYGDGWNYDLDDYGGWIYDPTSNTNPTT